MGARRREPLPHEGPLWSTYVALSRIYEQYSGVTLLPATLDRLYRSFREWYLGNWSDLELLLTKFRDGCIAYRTLGWTFPHWPSLWTMKGKADYPVHSLIARAGASKPAPMPDKRELPVVRAPRPL